MGAEGVPAPPAALREPVNMPVSLAPLEAYRLWAQTWETDPSAIVALESRWLTPWLPDLHGKVFVDLSCGAGRWLIHAQDAGRGGHLRDGSVPEMLLRGAQEARPRPAAGA